ncbi:hypothetical protein EB001_24870, partial [bacterium]|nr:hypothetical protein [bacterium]
MSTDATFSGSGNNVNALLYDSSGTLITYGTLSRQFKTGSTIFGYYFVGTTSSFSVPSGGSYAWLISVRGLESSIIANTTYSTSSDFSASNFNDTLPPSIVISSSSSLSYIENASGIVIDNAILLSDTGASFGSSPSATISISSNFLSGDVLAFTNQNGITGSYNSGTGVLTLTGTSSNTVTQFQTALRSITYASTSDDPTSNNTKNSRIISWVFNDGTSANNISNTATSTINITAVNDAPVITPGTTLSYTENGSAAAINSALTLTDA